MQIAALLKHFFFFNLIEIRIYNLFSSIPLEKLEIHFQISRNAYLMLKLLMLNLYFYLSKILLTLHAYKIRLKITHLEKVHFIKVNKLKLTQVELF